MNPSYGIALFIGLFAGPVSAQVDQLKSMETAQNLGTIIASEELCGLTLNQMAISDFIAENVDTADTGFAPMLSAMIAGQAFQLQGQSVSAKTAHCAAVAQSARHFGLIE